MKIIKSITLIFLLTTIFRTLVAAVVHADKDEHALTGSAKTLSSQQSSTAGTNGSDQANDSATAGTLSSEQASTSSTSSLTESSSNSSQSKETSSSSSTVVASKPAVRAKAAKATVDPTNIAYLATHGYALGVAANFNIFATNNYVQNNSVGDARIAANRFQADGGTGQSTIGWTSSSSNVDSHMLVVNTLADGNTGTYTRLNTDKTSGVFAADSFTNSILKNTSENLVDTDPLSGVADFSETGTSNFTDASQQIANVSAFYQDSTQLQEAFSDSFMKTVSIEGADYNPNGGINKTIDDSGQQHGLFVINVDTSKIQGSGGIKTDTDVLSIDIRIKTDDTTPPIVVLNFPNLTGTLTMQSLLDHLHIMYGSADGTMRAVTTRNQLLLNFPKLTGLQFNNVFVGTFLAPQATAQVNQLNTSISAIIAKNVTLANSFSTDGSEGIFNPPAFADADNHNNGSSETNQMTATVQTKKDDQSSSTDISENNSNVDLGQFQYNDVATFQFDWTGYSGAHLYGSTDGKTWTRLTADDVTTYHSAAKYPAKALKMSVDASMNEQTTFKASAATTYSFALLDSTADEITDIGTPVWRSDITTASQSFSLAVPNLLTFSTIVASTENTGYLTVKPDTTAFIELNNELDAPFTLTTTGNSSANTTPSAGATTKNVFLDADSTFTYLPNQNLINNAAIVFNKNGTDAFTKPPLLDNNQTKYQVTNFSLKVPMALRNNKATIGLDWTLAIGAKTQ
ncbi:collagen-binding domain-containing protein [Lapidilactobacillus bayanensis]|uniref:collagen-binding domain-containing protein n=1 Tax=Lapidilactobacillus bayanensis TaxID=2485998 RepID=UPI000F788B1C|nr:collagen-binding domain-containing protein [Lapidilactobacillus bayanensis]